MLNGEGNKVALGTESGKKKYYCGLEKGLYNPDCEKNNDKKDGQEEGDAKNDGRCGPNKGEQCNSCKLF